MAGRLGASDVLMPLHNAPGHSQQLTPRCPEHVPLRVPEQKNVPSQQPEAQQKPQAAAPPRVGSKKGVIVFFD